MKEVSYFSFRAQNINSIYQTVSDPLCNGSIMFIMCI